MEDFNQKNRSATGAAQTSEHNPDDLRIIEDQRNRIDDLHCRLKRLEVELERQHHEMMCVVADNKALKEEIESVKDSEPPFMPKPGDIWLDTEVEFPKEYYANALEGLVKNTMELFVGLHTLCCSLKGMPFDETSKDLEEKLDRM